jgi:hypothetical protein
MVTANDGHSRALPRDSHNSLVNPTRSSDFQTLRICTPSSRSTLAIGSIVADNFAIALADEKS